METRDWLKDWFKLFRMSGQTCEVEMEIFTSVCLRVILPLQEKRELESGNFVAPTQIAVFAFLESHN